MLRLSRDALREHGRVLAHPQLVRSLWRARIGECAHGVPRVLVINAAELANDHVAWLQRPDDVNVIGQVLIKRVELPLEYAVCSVSMTSALK